MKVSFDIDCTPEEARRFLGLPDVAPVNEAFVEELQKRVAEMAASMDAEKMMQQWMAAGTQGLGELQKAFFEQMTRAGGGKSGGKG
tara:strand:- start:332 stop:589 length:258 start_codon:yes stop_codon:yes gene_type:complete